MKKYLLAGVLILLFAMPLAAAEKESVKIKLPDGVYMYDSWIEKMGNGDISIRYEKFFFVKNNIIYSSKDALKKFGTVKINEPFLKEKKHKILLGGEKIGEIYNLQIDDDGHKKYEEKLFTKDIKEGPAYGSGGYGSAVRYMAVPEEYKEVKKKVYTTITQEEVDRVGKLVKEKLYDLVKNRKEITEYQLKHSELSEEYIKLLDKISDLNGDLYLGIYRNVFKIEKGSRKFTPFLVFAIEIAFSVKKDNVYVITSDYAGTMKIQGMLDVDGDGNEELIMEKVFSGLDEATYNIEIYKQKDDGKWVRIQRISWEVKS